MNTPPRIGIILGSTRPNRICKEIADWVQSALDDGRLEISQIDLREINLPFLDEPGIAARHHYQKEHTKRWSELVRSYDGFVLVYPQYNWGYPGVLKNALDFLYHEWAGKPVSSVCYGNHGGFQGFIAMRLVIQGLHMRSLATNPSLVIADEMFDENGRFKDIDSAFASYKVPFQSVTQELVSLLVE